MVRSWSVASTVLLLASVAERGAAQPPPAEGEWRPAIAVDVLDPRPSVTFELEPGLVLRAVNVPHAAVPSMGWMLEVRRGGGDGTLSAGNLLYHSLSFHGPYPNDFLAWIAREQHFPNERELPVWGTPYELRAVLHGATTALEADVAVFTSGRLEVAFRKLAAAHPQPLRARGESQPRPALPADGS